MGKCNKFFGYSNSLLHVIYNKFTAQYDFSFGISVPQHSYSYSYKPNNSTLLQSLDGV